MVLYVTKDKPSWALTDKEIDDIRRSHKKMSFEEIIEEWIENTKAMNEQELREHNPAPYPYKQTGPPWECDLVADEETIQLYASSIGDDNPLFTDPAYAAKTKYRRLIAPSTILSAAQYPGTHGFHQLTMPYPMGNYISGCGYEFYDVVGVGTRFLAAEKQKEFFEKKGSKGRLFFIIAEDFIWNTHGDLLGKQYGQVINIPMKSRFDVETMGNQILYERGPYQYSQEEVDKIVDCLESETRRGAEPRYWEDVEVGDTLGPIVVPPWTSRDFTVQELGRGLFGGYGGFETVYRHAKAEKGETGAMLYGSYVHPTTRWAYTTPAEHEDPLLSIYRGMALPFDGGAQRFQHSAKLLYNWIGDDGWLRTFYIAYRKAVYNGDVQWFSGEVVRKYKITEKGTDEPGGVPGEAEYGAVGIKIEGKNQLGEDATPGTARVYLPSRELGPVKLPIPHPPRPPYVPWGTHRRDWY